MAVVPAILSQHAGEAAFLWLLRDAAVRAPHYNQKDLAHLDDRVEAHIDGLRVAGDAGWELCAEQLAYEEPGEVFAAGLLALESKNLKRLEQVLAVAEDVPTTTRGFISALGWVTPQQLKGTGKTFLNGGSPFLKRLGIAACAIHRVDPGAQLDRALADDDAALRARALRAAGELGRKDLLPTLREHAGSDDEACRFWAAWSAVLLGERGRALESLKVEVTAASPFAARALQLVSRAFDGPAAQAWFKGLVQDPQWLRTVIVATGQHGDPHYVPWLIKQMKTPEVARIAGEAFAMITGVDLAYLDLEGEWPEGFEAGPTENSEDEDVGLDPDEDLPWPEPELVKAWWESEKGRFQAGTRYLAGQPVGTEHCRQVLSTGFQRQRNAAALELALLEPGKPLFETRAPGFRQQKLLGQKGQAA